MHYLIAAVAAGGIGVLLNLWGNRIPGQWGGIVIFASAVALLVCAVYAVVGVLLFLLNGVSM